MTVEQVVNEGVEMDDEDEMARAAVEERAAAEAVELNRNWRASA